MNVRKRLSLRTSAVLIDGAAKLYKKQMKQLVEDAIKLDEEFVVRNRTLSTITEEESSKSSSDVPPPEQMRQAVDQAGVSMETYAIEPCFSPPAIDRHHSFSTGYKDSKSSKSTKRLSSETVVSSVQSPKKRRTIYNQSKSDENFDDSDDPDVTPDESSNNETPDEETDSRETAKRAETTQDSESSSSDRTNNSRATSAQQSAQSGTIENSDHPNNDQRNSDQQSPNDVTLRRPSNYQDVKMSPTFTDVFDVVVGLPNNGEKTVYIDVTNSTDKSTVGSKSSDNDNTTKVDRTGLSGKKSDPKSVDQISGKADDDNSGSDRSVILMQAKDCRIPRVRQNKKRSKSSKNRKDQATQADIIYPQMSDNDANTAFNKELPFGCFQIYDSYDSRLPSKIVFCSLSDRVKRLYCMM